MHGLSNALLVIVFTLQVGEKNGTKNVVGQVFQWPKLLATTLHLGHFTENLLTAPQRVTEQPMSRKTGFETLV